MENIQSTFIEQLKKVVPANISLADELADLLDVSRDSAYRRIRGETVLSLDEVKKICNHYNLSLDSLLTPTQEMVVFHNRKIDEASFTFEMWLKSILSNLEMINSFPDKQLIFAAKDVPMFHYYKFPELAAFKMFFWMKSYQRYSNLAESKFDPKLISQSLLNIGEKIWAAYSQIPCIEIWSEETVTITLRQIEYYHEIGVLTSAQALHLFEEHTKMIDNIQIMARDGSKGNGENNFSMYKNEILIAESTIFFKMGDKRVTYLTYNVMNVLTTSNEAFCTTVEDHLHNLINKSVQISSSGEKERNKFFNKMQESILQFKKRIS